MSLISIGQMVDNKCDRLLKSLVVHFSRDGYLMQDQVSRKVIARGPKVGRLFPLQFTIPRTLSLASITVKNKVGVWHRRLGHPNNVILSNLMKRGLLGNIDQCSTHRLPLDCST
ncbi:unnamed protein product [Musa hybrid cultivar]